MTYIAIIGDVIDSKSLENRYDVQNSFKACLQLINEKYKEEVVSKFSLTLGDEFQGLLSTQVNIFQVIDDMNMMMKPYQIRFGIGLGEILTDINPDISIGADGPAYWNAREAINYIHEKNDYGQNHLAFQSDNILISKIINSLLAAGEAIKNNWVTSQQEVFETMLSENIYAEDFNQTLLAKKLDLDPSALSKRLKSSSIKVYFRTRLTARDLYQQELEEGTK
ncbi:SatD family protein [Streptococcus ictaluri]|uniref:SatD protein n=1 Tax=Streptococcus ictaluri 707-05 TaxID=764299 RepID=G5K373_9STRE|nr:SatD family protein [Streptococcus ictaluri]EHI69412.1 SatD protein [Streptococcus ictaluri 707-05]